MNAKLVVIVLFISIFSSCKQSLKESNQEVASVDKPQNTSNWKIIGTEPFWNIQILSDKVLFTMLNEKIDSVYFEIKDFEAVDCTTKFEFTDTDKAEAFLIITGGTNCSDGMSDNKFEYSATFNYNGLELKGCAEKK